MTEMYSAICCDEEEKKNINVPDKNTVIPIGELLSDTFIVPSYQRGYKWNEKHIIALLDDLKEFLEGSSPFYFIQTLVVCKSDNQWILIDGQQRLTTIHILLSYLQSNNNGFKIIYETRTKSQEFLEKITEKEYRENNKDNNSDYYHIALVFKAIEYWFNKSENKNLTDRFTNILTCRENEERNVRVIRYEYQSNKPQEIFNRLNSGKIILTSAELVKALFLTKQKNSLDSMQQFQLGEQWHEIELALQNDRFWYFLNKEDNDTPTRIDFFLDIISKKSEKAKKDSKQNAYTFLEFQKIYQGKIQESKIEADTMLKAWTNVREVYAICHDWFNDTELYHYIGYLITCGENINQLLNSYRDKEMNKGKFINDIKKKIVDTLPNDIDELNKGNKDDDIRKVLLLFNIESIIAQYRTIKKERGDNIERYKGFFMFPFDLYKIEKWDIEHVDSSNENRLKKEDDQKTWLETILADYSSELSSLKEEIEKFKGNIKNENFENFKKLHNKIIEIIDYESEDKINKNNIANLTLLDKATNRGYGNSLFATKRRIIIDNEIKGKFILPCTKNLFLKYYTKESPKINRWSREKESSDAANYIKAIKATLEPFYSKY